MNPIPDIDKLFVFLQLLLLKKGRGLDVLIRAGLAGGFHDLNLALFRKQAAGDFVELFV